MDIVGVEGPGNIAPTGLVATEDGLTVPRPCAVSVPPVFGIDPEVDVMAPEIV